MLRMARRDLLGGAEPRRGEQIVLTGFADGPQHIKWALSKVERAG